MLQEIVAGTQDLLGIDVDDLTVLQMSIRAVTIYVAAILLVRVGESRFMGKNTAFDMILGIILGSVLSRAITGGSAFLPSVVASCLLVAVHWVFSVASFHSSAFGKLVKGRKVALVLNNEVQWNNMRENHISRNDLETAIRTGGKVTTVEDVAEAHLERSGQISVTPRENPKVLRVVDIEVKDGVQQVRIELTAAA